MRSNCFKSLIVAALSLFFVFFPNVLIAQEEAHAAAPEAEAQFDPGAAILHHIADAHEFHFFDIQKDDGSKFTFSIPLPVILYSPQNGFDIFMSSKFHHGEAEYNGYKLKHEIIVPVDPNVRVYDFSITKNVAQLILAVVVLIWILLAMVKKYKSGQGVTSAPKGLQNAIEPVITFVRDDIAKPNLGPKYQKYFPYLLTLFFFILINNLFGMLPGAANVSGNIAFTAMLGIVSFFVILFSSNNHYWQHIFWFPGVPLPVKFIMLPVELLGVFTKPFALIVRLFANMTAGHIIILSFISLIFIFKNMSTVAGIAFSPISVVFSVFIYLIEILVAFIQAYIFTNLTAIFISGAIGDHHFEEDVVDTHHH
ncbi:MAG: F0F1 ATP synthase subunit A [Sphingobacteriales bacterium]|nr:F0F1 ATP synthase subunit A [Sphingobacteriales bacterium]